MSWAWKGVAASLFLAGLGASVYATRVEPRRYRLETMIVTADGGTLQREPAETEAVIRSPATSRATAASRLRILHLSDLHLCHPESDKIEFLQRITEQEFDLVALTGDIIEDYSGLAYLPSMLSRQPRLGAYAVLGNHDYFSYNLFHKTFGRLVRRFRHPRQRRDVKPLIEALERAGFTVLRNEAVRHAHERVHVVGMDYPRLGRDLLHDLVNQRQEGDYAIVLFHLPVDLENISASGAQLALGGHTHGGQIRLPGLGAVITDSELPRSRASGLFKQGATCFHISRGLGADPRTNIRFLCPPAATVLEVIRS